LLLLASLPRARATAAPAEALRPPRPEAIMTNINPEALFNACVAGDAAAVSRLLPAGGTPRNLSGQRFQFHTEKSTPLIAAAAYGHTEIVRVILERARNTTLDYANTQGYTAQLVAVQYQHADILRLLADRGANVNLADGLGNTALIHAVSRIHPDSRPRDPDPDGVRQTDTVMALLQLGAGTLLLHTPRATLFFNTTFPPRSVCI